jgi:hypothetical protein
MIRRHKWYYIIALLLFTSLLYFISRGEVIIIRADGNLPVRSSPVLPAEGHNVLRIMPVGERAQVIGCEDIKTDVVVHLRLETGETGYVGAGQYTLERRSMSLGLLIKPTQITFSCIDMFKQRSIRIK